MELNLPQSVGEYIAVFSKRKKLFFIPFTIAVILVIAIYPFLPKFYKTTALVMVANQEGIDIGDRRGRKGGDGADAKLRSLYVEMMEPDTMMHFANLLGRGERYANDPKRLRRFVNRMRRDMQITAQEGDIIEIGYTSPDPEWAARGANALAEMMVWIDRKSRQENAERRIRFLEQQLRIYKEKIQHSEKSFVVNKVSNDIEEALRRRSNILDQIEQFEKTSPGVIRDQNPSVYKLQTELAETRARLTQLSLSAREDSPMVRDLRRRLVELETAIAREKEMSASSPETPSVMPQNPAYAAAVRELRNVNNEIAFLRRRQTGLAQGVTYVSEDEVSAKQREQGVNEDIYRTLLENLEQAQLNLRMASFGDSAGVKILEEAEKPVLPSWPLPWQAAGFGLFVAIGAGAAAVMLREIRDSSLRGFDDAQRSFKHPILATIPDLYPTKSTVEATSGDMSPHMVALHNPQSLAAEHYRLLRTRILFITQKRPIQTLMFSSAVAGEGKTTTSCNMAISMANELDKKIALVDCDLRQSAVSRYLGIQQGKGLHEYLDNQATIDQVLKPTRLERLTVVTAGQSVENPSKLLTSPRMAELMADLRTRFDFIIMDAAPLVPLADVPILLNHVDALALVARVGETPKTFIRQAISTVENAQRAPLLGIVLTRVENTLPTYVNQYFVSGSAKRTRRS